MKETVQLEVCQPCLITVLLGKGEDSRMAALWRKFRGALTIFEDEVITTFRPCGACGAACEGVAYEAVHTFYHEEE
jgi:hypothetical protein